MRTLSKSVGSVFAPTILWCTLRFHVSLGSIHRATEVNANIHFTEFVFANSKNVFFLGILPANTMTPMVSLRANISLLDINGDSVVKKGAEHSGTEPLIRAVALIYSNSNLPADMQTLALCHSYSSNFELNIVSRLKEEKRDFVLQEKIINETSLITINLKPEKNEDYTARIFSCWDSKDIAVESTRKSLVHLASSVSFRNSFGYLPALLIERLPVRSHLTFIYSHFSLIFRIYSGILAVLYGFVDLYYSLLLARYHRSAFRLQYLLFIELLLATSAYISIYVAAMIDTDEKCLKGEAAIWFFTLDMLNRNGDPICCPYPASVLFATIIEVTTGCFARVLTALICLGYGIVRQSITRPEVTVLLGLSLCYFASACCLRLSHIVNLSNGIAYPSIEWRILGIATNACFMSWIFNSLSLSRQNLRRFGQHAKLEMYTCLHRILVAYSLLSILLEIAITLAYASSMLSNPG